MINSFAYAEHDIQVAFFKINQEKNQVVCDITIEKDDLDEILLNAKQSTSEELIISYLKEHFAIKLNGRSYPLTFQFAESKEKHIRLKAITPKFKKKVKSLSIANKCLISIEDHANIIEVRLNDQERDFLMNKFRTEINIDFKRTK